jgi:hypothetical protein
MCHFSYTLLCSRCGLLTTNFIRMILFKPYSSIKDFLQRYTLLKIGTLHIRLHKITDKDRTTLFHNHPFNYVSIILKNGYTETYLENGIEKVCSHNFLSIVKRKHSCYHRIDKIKGETLTLFIAYGKYDWNAFNTKSETETDGVYQRVVNDKKLWCKKTNGIWFIGHSNKIDAENEKRHSIHQCSFETVT